MRTILLLGVVAFAAFTAGWFKINREGDSTTIEINRAEIRSDARRAIDKGRDILDKREAALADRQNEGQFDDRQFNDGSFNSASSVNQSGFVDQRFDDQRFDDQRYVDPRFDNRGRFENQPRFQDDRYARPIEDDRFQFNDRR